MTLIRAVELVVFLLVVWVAITQIALPLWNNELLFPALTKRKQRKLESRLQSLRNKRRQLELEGKIDGEQKRLFEETQRQLERALGVEQEKI